MRSSTIFLPLLAAAFSTVQADGTEAHPAPRLSSLQVPTDANPRVLAPHGLLNQLGAVGKIASDRNKNAVGVPLNGGIVPRAYVVEFADDAEHAMAKHSKRSVSSINIHDEFHSYLARAIAIENGLGSNEKRGFLDSVKSSLSSALTGEDAAGTHTADKGFTTRYSYDHAGIFRGVSVLLGSDSHAPLLAKAPGVVKVFPVKTVAAPTHNPQVVSQKLWNAAATASHRASSDKSSTKSPDKAQDAAKHSRRDGGPSYVGGALDPTYASDTYGPHMMTGVDVLHAAGVLGKGITVAMIDSGVDYTHPALNGGKAPGTACFGSADCQVIGGRNYVDDGGKPDDPFDNCNGHGSETASVLLAQASPYNNFTGVAPQAKMKSYRIFGCGDGSQAQNDVIIQAMVDAAQDGNDVINMSLGVSSGWSGSDLATIVDRIVASGIPVIVARATMVATAHSWAPILPLPSRRCPSARWRTPTCTASPSTRKAPRQTTRPS